MIGGWIAPALHESIDNTLDHRDGYPPLCSAVFTVHEAFGGVSKDALSMVVYEDWLVRVNTFGPSKPVAGVQTQNFQHKLSGRSGKR